mmetsp:Transcript_81479/g.161765  ORF Transcript_81479/g.161765 Transcript_81479/m.161765 type:complete len:106 (+) Transcript_81479:134-451(+)
MHQPLLGPKISAVSGKKVLYDLYVFTVHDSTVHHSPQSRRLNGQPALSVKIEPRPKSFALCVLEALTRSGLTRRVGGGKSTGTPSLSSSGFASSGMSADNMGLFL